MRKEPSIFIVILHFGDPHVTRRCIESIIDAKLSYTEGIVVDNASNLPIDFAGKKIQIIRNERNVGYAVGMNRGIRVCLSKGADYILLLNNDTLIDVNFLTNLIAFLENHKDVGIASPAVKFQKEKKILYDVGGHVNRIFGRTSHDEIEAIENNIPILVDYVSGCCMLVKREVFDRIGFFDEAFFLYYEDVDFCMRAKRLGYETFLLPNTFIYHSLSQSAGKNSPLALYHQTASAMKFGKKHFHWTTRLLHKFFIFIQSLYIFFKNPVVGRYAFLGFWHGIR